MRVRVCMYVLVYVWEKLDELARMFAFAKEKMKRESNAN